METRTWQRITGQRLTAFLSVSLIAVVCATGCRFKVSSAGEGQEFARRGAYPVGAPSWVKVPPGSETKSQTSAGLVPLTFGSPPVVKESESSIPNGQMFADDDRTKARAAMAARVASQSPDNRIGQTSAQPDDMFGRIEKACPGMEKSVNEALTADTQTDRIAKYETLTTRCSDSVDLWILLGKEYQGIKKNTEASRSFQRALSLEPSNAEAKQLLEAVRKPAPSMAPGAAVQQRSRLAVPQQGTTAARSSKRSTPTIVNEQF